VRYKTSIDVEGNKSIDDEPAAAPNTTNGASSTPTPAPASEPVELSFALMKRVVYDNVGVMDKYMPGIMAVVYGGASPTEAIAKVES
jgi:hypothetical protein